MSEMLQRELEKAQLTNQTLTARLLSEIKRTIDLSHENAVLKATLQRQERTTRVKRFAEILALRSAPTPEGERE